MIMVVIVISICWVLYVIHYRTQSTSAAHVVEVGIWGELSQQLFSCCVVSGQVLQVWSTGESSILGHEGRHGGLVNIKLFHIDHHRKRYQRLLRLVLQTYPTCYVYFLHYNLIFYQHDNVSLSHNNVTFLV